MIMNLHALGHFWILLTKKIRLCTIVSSTPNKNAHGIPRILVIHSFQSSTLFSRFIYHHFHSFPENTSLDKFSTFKLSHQPSISTILTFTFDTP
ncbi:hypothetical protein CDL12_16148 [Handroanthus impetiginosus]|uniref:Uncharacterized protein n=1 Tax=Handroanthus impetiginosus TaxID=429701 RepID=A0A2G9H1T2_9LAMI|nr:hypothetical protein CDL12_16148 [Handroanthus impetiginosus]